MRVVARVRFQGPTMSMRVLFLFGVVLVAMASAHPSENVRARSSKKLQKAHQLDDGADEHVHANAVDTDNADDVDDANSVDDADDAEDEADAGDKKANKSNVKIAKSTEDDDAVDNKIENADDGDDGDNGDNGGDE
ncbi:hypothetical protein CAPTEDRAFT_209763 [Capitella teleta]|uniref:Uncharacterized protein n=1 Tax=Capitella teleta TaxID=283909 RepID=R7TXT9_CAPTE|nr:hypothetical protein CAPTEDRAFT_209763 [Capitella teleta]|eukprot:ELT96251.1 hypothetical protein CAPTEDRAFT_209763 [Capitella teleta]